MRTSALVVVLMAFVLPGCGNGANTGMAPTLTTTGGDGFKVKCDSVESCKRDLDSDDIALKLHANQFLTQRELMDDFTKRTLHTENAEFEQSLIYWRHAVLYCSDEDAKRDRCVSIDSPDVPEKIREVLKKELTEAAGRPQG